MTIKELLKENDRVYFSIMPDDKDVFLRLAKNEGFVWLNGTEISETDACNGHMSVRKDYRIASVPWFAWFHPSTNHILKLDFAEFLNGNVVESNDQLMC